MNNPTRKPATNLFADSASLDTAADQAIAACGGDARETVKALLIANEFLEREMERADTCTFACLSTSVPSLLALFKLALLQMPFAPV